MNCELVVSKAADKDEMCTVYLVRLRLAATEHLLGLDQHRGILE
jgi:hypothetical protein